MSNVIPMLTTTEALVVGTSVVGALQAYASLQILVSSAYTGGQKVRQLFLVWLLPFIGAVVVLLFMENDSAPAVRRDTAFTAAPGGNPEGIGTGDGHA